MSPITSWALWIAISALLAGFGKFLDEYHLSSRVKDQARDLLIAAFILIERPVLPDIPKLITRLLWWPFRGHWRVRVAIILGVVCSAGFLFLVIGLFFGRTQFGPSPGESFVSYLISWLVSVSTNVFWLLFALWSVLSVSLLSVLFAGWILRRIGPSIGHSAYLVWSLLAFVAALIPSTIIGFGGLLVFFQSGGYLVPVLIIALLICALPGVLISTMVLSLGLLRTLLAMLHFVALNVLEAASSPDKSPFSYAGSLLGLLTFLLKVAMEALAPS